ncbi:MAG: hypothetical protein HOI66_06680 [Verrucomicrobia bacterium]|nr:hypothetical protein [Verrucomicrobiota bacterium]
MGIRIVEETEDEGGVTQILAAELGDDTGFQLGLTVNGVRPTRGQWIRNLEGVMVSHRFPFEGSRNPLFKWEPRAEGLWLSEESAIVVGVADSVSMWNYETGEQLFTLRLGAEDLRRSVNTVAYFVKPVRLSQDGGRILVTLSEQVYDTKSGDVRQSELKTFRMIDIARQEVLSLPEFEGSHEVFIDPNLTRALVHSENTNEKSDVWDFRTSTVLASITGAVGRAGGLLAGSLGSKLRFTEPVFSHDGETLVTASSDGIAFWGLPGMNPELAFRRDENGLSLFWDKLLIDDSFRLQVRDSVTAGEWQDIESGDSGELKVDTGLGNQRFYRWSH